MGGIPKLQRKKADSENHHAETARNDYHQAVGMVRRRIARLVSQGPVRAGAARLAARSGRGQDDRWGAAMTQFAAGALIGGIVMAIALTVAPNSLVNRAHDALHECERNLPRSQQCHLVAVPNEVKE